MTAPMPSSSSSGWPDREPGDRTEQSGRPEVNGPPGPGDQPAPERPQSDGPGPESGQPYDPWAAPSSLADAPGLTDEVREEPSTGREVLEGLAVALAVGVTGVLLGVLWAWLSPKVPLIANDNAVFLKDAEGEAAIGGDGAFTLIALAMGAVTGAVVFWVRRRGGVGVVVGLAVGGLLGSLLGWWLGTQWGPTDDVVAHAREIGPDKVFDGPLELRAKSALLAWPAAAVLIHLLHTALFGQRDPEPPQPGW